MPAPLPPRQPRSRPARRDPQARPVDGVAPWARFVNKRPDRHYVGVYMGDPDAMALYPSIGFVPEIYEQGGVQPAGGMTGKIGDQIIARGHLLMSCSLERWKEIQQYGADGDTGYELAEQIERKILDRKGEHDPIRGPNGRMYIDFENETTAEEHVRA